MSPKKNTMTNLSNQRIATKYTKSLSQKRHKYESLIKRQFNTNNTSTVATIIKRKCAPCCACSQIIIWTVYFITDNCSRLVELVLLLPQSSAIPCITLIKPLRFSITALCIIGTAHIPFCCLVSVPTIPK